MLHSQCKTKLFVFRSLSSLLSLCCSNRLRISFKALLVSILGLFWRVLPCMTATRGGVIIWCWVQSELRLISVQMMMRLPVAAGFLAGGLIQHTEFGSPTASLIGPALLLWMTLWWLGGGFRGERDTIYTFLPPQGCQGGLRGKGHRLEALMKRGKIGQSIRRFTNRIQ